MVLDHGTFSFCGHAREDRHFKVQGHLPGGAGTRAPHAATRPDHALRGTDRRGRSAALPGKERRLDRVVRPQRSDRGRYRGPGLRGRRLGGPALVRLLLDTHIWLWSLLDPKKLTPRVVKALEKVENELWLSPMSTWELLILVGK